MGHHLLSATLATEVALQDLQAKRGRDLVRVLSLIPLLPVSFHSCYDFLLLLSQPVIYTTPRPPNSAGRIILKAGLSTEDSSTGVSWAKSSTPSARMMVVTMEVVAMAMVEMTSPSSLPGFTLAAPWS